MLTVGQDLQTRWRNMCISVSGPEQACLAGLIERAIRVWIDMAVPAAQSAKSGAGGDEGADEVGEAFFRPHASRRGEQDGTRRWFADYGRAPRVILRMSCFSTTAEGGKGRAGQAAWNGGCSSNIDSRCCRYCRNIVSLLRSSRRGVSWRVQANSSRGSISRASMWSAFSDPDPPSEILSQVRSLWQLGLRPRRSPRLSTLLSDRSHSN